MVDPVVLTGERVRLEPLATDHVDGLLAAALESRQTYGFTQVPATREAMAAYVRTALEDHRAGWELPFAIRDRVRDAVVGSTRFMDFAYWSAFSPPSWPPSGRTAPPPHAIPSAAEVGHTWLSASAQRGPSNTEAKRLLLTHAFEVWHVLRITLKTDARNERSRRAIERIGGRFEGVRRAHMPAADGTVRDTAYFSIVADEWPAVRERLDGLMARMARPRE